MNKTKTNTLYMSQYTLGFRAIWDCPKGKSIPDSLRGSQNFDLPLGQSGIPLEDSYFRQVITTRVFLSSTVDQGWDAGR